MKAMRQHKKWMALLALVFVFAACKGESPTAPPPGGGTGGGGTTTPPTTSLSLTASNGNPVVDSVVLITANVTQNGAPAPNGTAVEFVTDAGTFSATSIVTSLLRTTTNGIATVELRSTVAGPIHVQATVGSVSRTVTVTFKVGDVVPPPTSTAPTITSVTPGIGVPAGGQRIHILGKNFKDPVRVLFDVGGPLPVEALVISSSATDIEVFTPSVNLGAGQQLASDVIVITEAGSVNEQRASLADAFTFRNEQLTPIVSTTSPVSGPVTGGTRVTIFGEGFQAPVQVLFGSAEARVLAPIEFNQIIVETPAARDTSGTGSGTVVGPVPVTVRNINSQREVTLADGFHYVAAVDITSFRPVQGPATGGTDVVIDGIGFLPGAVVIIGGVRATPLQVTGTRILARTNALPSPCEGANGGITVRNPDNGDSNTFTDELFTYIGIPPAITSVVPNPGVAGGAVSVTVRDPGVGALGSADIRFNVNGRTVIPSPDHITVGSGTQAFSVTLPLTGITFPTVACDAGGGLIGTQLGAAELPLTFQNTTNGCDASSTIEVLPPASLPNPCVPPSPQATVTNPASTACPGLAFGDDSVAAAGGSTLNITVTNSASPGSANLVISTATISGNPDFTVDSSGLPASVPPGGQVDIPVTFAATTTGARQASVRLTTNDPARPIINVCVSGNGVP